MHSFAKPMDVGSLVCVVFPFSAEKCSSTIFMTLTVILAAINIGLIAYIIWLHRRGKFCFIYHRKFYFDVCV